MTSNLLPLLLWVRWKDGITQVWRDFWHCLVQLCTQGKETEGLSLPTSLQDKSVVTVWFGTIWVKMPSVRALLPLLTVLPYLLYPRSWLSLGWPSQSNPGMKVRGRGRKRCLCWHSPVAGGSQTWQWRSHDAEDPAPTRAKHFQVQRLLEFSLEISHLCSSSAPLISKGGLVLSGWADSSSPKQEDTSHFTNVFLLWIYFGWLTSFSEELLWISTLFSRDEYISESAVHAGNPGLQHIKCRSGFGLK